MPWNAAGAPGEPERAFSERLQRLERRLVLLEQKPVLPGNVSSDFLAHEGETLFISAPVAGLVGLLPAPTSRNRGARIHLVFLTANTVRLACVNGTINGQTSLSRDVAGAYSAVSDGALGWSLESLELAAHLRGVGLTVDTLGKLRPRRRPRLVQMTDYFKAGNAASGSIGELGWNLLGTGTPAYARADASFSSTVRNALTTSAAANDRSVLSLGETETRDVATAAQVTILQSAVRLPALTSIRFFFGLQGTLATEPSAAADSLGMYFDSAVGSNWMLISRSGSAGSPVNSGVAVPADTGVLVTIHQATSGAFSFYAGNTRLGTISTGISTAAANLGFRLETLTTAAKTARIAYFNLEADPGVGSASVFDDDSFLEV